MRPSRGVVQHRPVTPTPHLSAARRATTLDREAVVETVVAAFTDDPAWAYITGGRPELARLFASTLYDARVGTGQVWMHEGATSVALWDVPHHGAAEPAVPQELWDDYRGAAGPLGWGRLRTYDEAVAVARPDGAFWYLGVLATHPSARGRGLASTVLEPVFAQADSQGLVCCLETSKIDNLHFYRHRGFTAVTPVEMTAGPATWWLTRPAR